MAVEYLTWWPLSVWISPGAAWFLFLNVLVAAIAVTSRVQQVGRPPSRRRLCRSASSMVLDRLPSFSMFSIHPAAEWCHYRSTEAEEREVSEAGVPEPAMPEPATTAPRSALVATAPADAAASTSESADDETEAEEKPVSSDELYVLGRQSHARESPSPPQPPAAPAVAVPTAEATSAVQRPRHKEEPAKVAEFAKPKRHAHAYAEVEGKAELNARAELFIRQFREELKLQRLNSILRQTHALGRRAGAPTSP